MFTCGHCLCKAEVAGAQHGCAACPGSTGNAHPCTGFVVHLQHTRSAADSAWHVSGFQVRYAANEKELLHLKTLVVKVFRLDSVEKACKRKKTPGESLDMQELLLE